MKLKNVLVTGGTGFVGGNLVDALLYRGCSVVCLVRNSNRALQLKKPGVRLISGDLSNHNSLREAVYGMDAIFHIAGAIKAASRQDFFEANQLGTRRLLQAVADVNPDLKRFVHMSSLAAAGPSKDGRKLREDESPHPISWYGESKLESEREVLEFAKTYPVTILRPSAVYGPRDMETLLIFRMIQRGCLFTPGTSSRKFSLIHVADLCEACIQAAENNTQSGEIFFISRPEVYRWEDVGDEISRSLKKSYIRVPFPKWIAKVAGAIGSQWSNWTGRAVTVNRQKILELLEPFWVCDPSKAMKIIGFSASIPLDRGIKDTVAWYQKIGFL